MQKKLSDPRLAALLALDAADANGTGPLYGDAIAQEMAAIWRPTPAIIGSRAAGGLAGQGLARRHYSKGGPIRYEITHLGREAASAARMADRWPALEPGDPIPAVRNGGQDGYVAGHCGHRVAASEWRAGSRNCERCGA